MIFVYEKKGNDKENMKNGLIARLKLNFHDPYLYAKNRWCKTKPVIFKISKVYSPPPSDCKNKVKV